MGKTGPEYRKKESRDEARRRNNKRTQKREYLSIAVQDRKKVA